MKKSKKNTRENSFKVPKNYFDNFETRLMDRMELEKNMPVKDGFQVPSGYFETLDNTVLERLDGNIPKVIRLNSYKKWYTAAAGIAAAFLIGFFVVNHNNAKTNDLDDVASAEVETYIENGYLALNSYDIVATFDNIALEDIRIAEPLDDDELVDYLYENLENYNGVPLELDETKNP